MHEVLWRVSMALGLFAAACSESTSVPKGQGGGGAGGGATTSGTTGSGGGTDPGCVGGANATGATGTGGSTGVAGANGTGAGGTVGQGGSSAGGSGAGGKGQGGAGGNTADAGSGAPVPSPGCGKAATETPAQFVKHSLMSSGTSRDFYTYLPTGYSPQKPYRTIFAFHPCGGSGNPGSNIPIQNESKQDAIIILPQSKGACYENQTRNSPDVTLFDNVLAYAEANYCVDESRIFAIGYSAGAWMSIILGCERAGIIRAHAQVSGGLPMFIRPGVDCRGSVAALFIHDTGDPTNTVNGGIAGRDVVLRLDRCGTATMPWAPAPCVAYQECKPGFPVVWCPTTGKGHDRQDSFAPAPIWKFLSQF